MTHGRQIVTTPGTPVLVASDWTIWSRVTFQALYANTGYIAIGGPTVRARDGEQNAPRLRGGTSLGVDETRNQTFTNIRLIDLWVDATVVNDGVGFVAE